MKRFFIIAIILNICTFLVTSIVASHNAVATGTASVTILPPLGTIVVAQTQSLNFGSFYLPDKQATLGLSEDGSHWYPYNDTIEIGGTDQQTGTITISGMFPGEVYVITLPNQVNLTLNTDDGDTTTIDGMTANLSFVDRTVGSSFPVISNFGGGGGEQQVVMNEATTLTVYGELVIEANQAYGAYSGNYNITAIK